MEVTYKLGDEGWYFDGAWGHVALRWFLAGMVEYLKHEDLAKSLRGNRLDDGSDEDEALEVLQSRTTDGLTWVYDGGDLLLLRDDQII